MGERRKWNEHFGEVLDSINSYDVIECIPCGFIHIIPIPTQEELQEFYENKYFVTRKNDYFELQKKDLDWWRMNYDERYDLFKRHLPENVKPSILDVGSGPGFFLQRGKELGWDVLGLEPSPRACEYANSMGVQTRNQPLSDNSVNDLDRYDVVYSHGVLEHVQDPHAALSAMYRLLKPGGLLFVSAANDYNPLQLIARDQLGYEPWWLCPPEHINYFSVGSMTEAVKKNKFKIIDIKTSFPMELFLLMGDDYIGSPELGPVCHKKRKNLEFSLVNSENKVLKNEFARMLSGISIGRQVEVLGKKGR